MAEWGKYLKNAVANVEQQLDKVLLENQNQTQSPRASISPSTSTRKPPRPDLQERLRRAATASKGHASDSTGSTPQPDDRSTGTSAAVEGHNVGSDLGTDPNSTLATRTEAETLSGAEPEKSQDAGSKIEAQIVGESRVPAAADEVATGSVDIVTTKELLLAPDLNPLLNQVRKIALDHQGDDTLELVDGLEAFKTQYDAYDANLKERLRSMNSKIAYLSQERAAETSGSEQRVALLLEEGQRLSQQELKLGLIIKRLRAERAAASSRETVVQAKDKELAVLRAEKRAIMNQLEEKEALAEHFRGLAESASVGNLNGSDSSGALTSARAEGDDSHRDSYGNLKRRLEAAESNHEVAKRTWHDLESSLLARIAELELSAETRSTAAAHVQDSLREAQDSARETRNQMIALQDELDANQERWYAKESQYRAEIDDLQAQLRTAQLKVETLEAQTHEPENKRQEEEPKEHSQSTKAHTERSEEPSVTLPQETDPLSTDLDHPAVVIDAQQTDIYPQSDSVGSLEAYNDNGFIQSSEFLNGPNGPVGAAGPFGSLADDFDSDHRPSLSRDDSRDMFEDSFSFMAPSASRRESSIVGSEAVHGSQLHIVKKLTLTVRRLENELSTVRKTCELYERQREEAQSEVVRLVDAQDNLAALELKYAELEKANNDLTRQVKRLETLGIDKDERIDELEADVRDLKDMYREQVEALITQIEELRSS